MLRAWLGLVVLLLACRVGAALAGTSTLSITDATVKQLRDLRAEAKFQADAPAFYPGAPNEAVRSRCEQRVNALIDRLVAGLPSHPTQQYVLEQLGTTVVSFGHEDFEERERLLLYLERIMAIAGIPSSDGLLNQLRYGFDPNNAP